MKSIIIVGATALACTALYLLYKSRNGQKTLPTAEPAKLKVEVEAVKELKMSDVAAFFQSLRLDPKTSKPFITQDMGTISSLVEFAKEGNYADKKLILLGVMQTSTDRVEQVKVLACDELEDKVMEVIGEEKLVVVLT